MNEFEVVKSIVQRVLKNSCEINLNSEIRALPGMDSLKLIQFVVAVEKHFKVRFNTRFILEMTDFEDLISKMRDLK